MDRTDEIIYTLLGRSLWQNGTLSILGGDTGFYTLLYPGLVGLPLGMDDLETGRRILQVLQALVMSATAVPVYLWGRRFVRRRWALTAAALTLTLPSLGYSSLVMSEALYLPLGTVALWTLARALERPTAGRQLVLALAVVLAVVLPRACRRSSSCPSWSRRSWSRRCSTGIATSCGDRARTGARRGRGGGRRRVRPVGRARRVLRHRGGVVRRR